MSSVFLSYSRNDSDVVCALAEEIRALGFELWLDTELTGGQRWWDEVLKHIRHCGIFVFALSETSLISDVCKLEYGYASGLNKPILPVVISGGISYELLPEVLSVIQLVDWQRRDKQSAIRLAKALYACSPVIDLPDPLPPHPALPVSELSTLKAQILYPSPLALETQSVILLRLKDRLRQGSKTDDVFYLIDLLGQRGDLYESVAKEIEATMKAAARNHNDAELGKSAHRVLKDPVRPDTSLSKIERERAESHTIENSHPSSFFQKITGRRRLVIDDHVIEIKGLSLTGEENIFYDGKEVSRKKSVLGATHRFSVNEGNQAVNYEVKMGTRWSGVMWVQVFRNTVCVYSDR